MRKLTDSGSKILMHLIAKQDSNAPGGRTNAPVTVGDEADLSC